MVEMGAVWIVGVLCLMSFIWIAGSNGINSIGLIFEIVVKLMCRCTLGITLLYGGNLLLQQWGYSVKVGINAVTLVCVTLLGLPGTVLLWGLTFFL